MTEYFDPFWQAEDSSGAPIAGSTLTFSETGTSTPKNTFTDSGFGTPNSNPVVADGFGRFGPIFLDISSGLYRVIFKDADGVTIKTRDNIGGALSTATFNLVDDTSPQLGGPLDTNSFSINESKGADIAAATTTDIFGGNDGNTIHITGNTQIDDFTDTSSEGQWRKLIFDGTPQVTSGSGITVFGGTRTAVAGDMLMVFADTVSAFDAYWVLADGKAAVADGGLIIQVAETVDVTNRSTSSATYVSTSVTAILGNNLKDTGSRVRIRVYGNFGQSLGGQFVKFTIHDGTTVLTPAGVDSFAGFKTSDATPDANEAINNFAFEFIDSPANVTPKTYTLQWLVSSGTALLGRNNDGTTVDTVSAIITLEELD